MHRYILISEKAAGFVGYGFNKVGFLIEFRNCLWEATVPQTKYLLEQLGHAFHIDLLKSWAKSQSYTLVKVEVDLSFTRFWEEYGNKRSPEKAEPEWNKMPLEKRQFLLWNNEAYDRYLARTGVAKMYATRFFKEAMHNDWDKIKDKKQPQQK